MKSSLTLLTTCFILLITLYTSQAHTPHTPIPFATKHIIDDNYAGAQAAHPADIDGDGDIDILGASRDNTSITWWENSNSIGTNWSEHTIDTAVPGAIIALGFDIDQDGDTDVLGAAFNANDIAWWENTSGDGSSWTRHDIDTNFGSVYDVTAADLDHDGDLDVAGAASTGNEIAWWENVNGDGSSWNKASVDAAFNFASSVTTADVNGDGRIDIIATAGGDDVVAWWNNSNGDGSSWSKQIVATAFDFTHWVDANDVDGDGDLDILATALNANDIAWWENNNGDGLSWSRHDITTNFGGAHSVTTADLDADGDTDVLGSALNADLITWWENSDGTGSSWIEYTIDPFFDEAHSVVATDIDSDGDLDVLGAARTANDVVWWDNETLHANALYPSNLKESVATAYNAAFGVNAADIDADGDTDILGVAALNNQVTWWANDNGIGTSWTPTIIDNAFAAARSLSVADIDQNGTLDVAAAAVADNDISWWSNTVGDGSNWIETPIDTNFGGAFWVHIDDVDSDGDMDVLGAGFNSGLVAWWENSAGDGSAWTEHTVSTGVTTAVGVHTADYDGDGDTDIVGASFGILPSGTNGRIIWWENLDGSGTSWTERDVDSNYLGAVGVYSADVDHDGDIDILGAANIAEEFTWWQNVNGDGTVWSRQAIGTGFANAESVYGIDLDDDGDIDILGGSQNDNTVAWWENQAGDGSIWVEHIVDDNIGQAVAVFAADINGNGRTDILAAAAGDDEIVWYPNVGGQLALTTTAVAPTTSPAGQATALLRLTANHNGRTNDNDAELTTLHFLLESTPGNPLTNANDLIESITIYLDDGSGTFAIADDTPITTSNILTTTTGQLQLTFSDDDIAVQLSVGTPRTYFIVAHLTLDAHQQTPSTFQITHLVDKATAQDSLANLFLRIAYAPDVTAVTQATQFRFADLTLNKTVYPQTAVVGNAITYTLTFTNIGNITSTQTMLTDTLPSALINPTFHSNWPITATNGITYTWQLASMPPQTSGIITITGQLAPDLVTPTTLTNTATISSQAIDPILSNNTAHAPLTIIAGGYHLYLPSILKP